MTLCHRAESALGWNTVKVMVHAAIAGMASHCVSRHTADGGCAPENENAMSIGNVVGMVSVTLFASMRPGTTRQNGPGCAHALLVLHWSATQTASRWRRGLAAHHHWNKDPMHGCQKKIIFCMSNRINCILFGVSIAQADATRGFLIGTHNRTLGPYLARCKCGHRSTGIRQAASEASSLEKECTIN
jgi:hypothetical protein